MLPRLSVTAATGRTHSTYVTSVVAWLDTDDDERRRMRELITMFRDQGAVDELGMKRIRDAFSNRLFPGTSVLWSRARYLFFVRGSTTPWKMEMALQEAFGQPRQEELLAALAASGVDGESARDLVMDLTPG